MSEQLHMTNKTPNESETAVFTSPDGKNILEATQFKELPVESKLGNSIISAAERINNLLVSGVEFRDTIKNRAEASTEFAKEKLKAFGGAALLVCDTAIGFGILGAEAASEKVSAIQGKAAEAGANIKNEFSASYTDFKDTIDFAKNSIKENVNQKAETISNFKNEKVAEVRNFFHQKRVEAEQRKELRIEKRNQRKAEIKQFFETTKEKTEKAVEITKDKMISIGETAIAFSIVGAEVVSQNAMDLRDKVQKTGENIKEVTNEKIQSTRESLKQKRVAAEIRVLARKKAINDFTKRAQAAGTAAREAASNSWKNSKPEKSTI